MAQKIEVVRGTSNMFTIAIKDADGQPYTLGDGESLVFGVKKSPRDDHCVLVKSITKSANGNYNLSLDPADTANLEHGLYYYDVGLRSGKNAFYNVIEMSEFFIKPNITESGDGS